MPINIIIKNNKACPFILCDHCGEEILDAADATAAWREKNNGDHGRQPCSPIFYLHMDCDDKFMTANSQPNEWWATDDLDLHILYLTKNTNWKRVQAEAAVQIEDSLG